MRIPPKQAAEDVSETSDGESDPTSPLEVTSLDESTLLISVESAETSEHPASGKLADLVQAQLAELDLGSNDGLQTPSTARDLYDASPRASPSPEPRQHQDRSIPDLTPVETDGEQLSNDFVADFQHLDLAQGRKTYSVKDEPLPVMPVFDKKFQDCLKSGKAIADYIHAGLDACSLATEGDSELGRLRARAARLRSYESPATRFIGIVGDSAADLAHKDDHGSAVTSFVTEYHRRSLRHEAPFTIEVEYCNEAEINEQLHELLVSYRELYQPGIEKELENNEQLYQEIEKKSTVAASTLQSIFPDHPEATPIRMKDQSDGAFEQILENLKRLASLIEWPADAKNGRWTATAASAAECHDKVAYFMKKGLWPLTNVVRIYLNAQVLKTGVILADLPGYRDINLARVRKAEQYLLRCHEVFIVANINRVISDQSVERFDIDLPAAEKKYKTVVNSEAGKKALRAKKTAWERNGSAAAAQIADTEYKYLFVSARNTTVERALRQRYETSLTTLSINVFCVGNRDYEGAEYRSQEARQKALKGSGIPDLRRFCHSIVGHAQYDASIHFLEVELASLVQSLEVWLSVSEQEKPVTVDPQIITDLQANLEQEIENYAEDTEDMIESGIADPMTSYKAFCRQNGNYCTQAVGARSWNAELLGNMTETMLEEWRSLHQILGPLDRHLQKSVANDCKEMRDKLKALGAPDTVIASFRLKERELLYLLKDIIFETTREIQNIEFNALGDHISSFILDLMIPTYRACTAETGKGTMARMHSTMKRRLDKRDLFILIRNRVKEQTGELFEQKMDTLRESVVGMCTEVRDQLEAFGGAERDVQRGNPEEVEMVRGVVKGARRECAVLWGGLERVKKRRDGR
ncbi:MAG: hypothetical protein Q9215_007377 [Flavoplaca cf. flavocitrina]